MFNNPLLQYLFPQVESRGKLLYLTRGNGLFQKWPKSEGGGTFDAFKGNNGDADLDVLILESNNTQLPNTISDFFSSIRTQEMSMLGKQAEGFTCTTRILNNDVAA